MRPNHSAGAVVAAVTLLTACGAGVDFGSYARASRPAMPGTEVVQLDGAANVTLTLGEIDIAVNGDGVLAVLAGELHMRDLHVFRVGVPAQTSILSLAPLGSHAGPLSLAVGRGDVLIYDAYSSQVHRFSFDGREVGKPWQLPGVMSILGVERDSLTLLLADMDEEGSLRYDGVGRTAWMKTAVRPMLPESSEVGARSRLATPGKGVPFIAVAGELVARMDTSTGAVVVYGGGGEAVAEYPALRAPGSAAAEEVRMVGIYYDGGNRLWRVRSENGRTLVDIFHGSAPLGVLAPPCVDAQGASVSGEYAALLCTLPGSVGARALQPLLLKILG